MYLLGVHLVIVSDFFLYHKMTIIPFFSKGRLVDIFSWCSEQSSGSCVYATKFFCQPHCYSFEIIHLFFLFFPIFSFVFYVLQLHFSVPTYRFIIIYLLGMCCGSWFWGSGFSVLQNRPSVSFWALSLSHSLYFLHLVPQLETLLPLFACRQKCFIYPLMEWRPFYDPGL